MKELSPLEIDALTEIINIGVGRAASSLNDITGAHIQLKVPRIELFPLEKLTELLGRLGHTNVSTVIQTFKGEFTGSAALLFPPESTLRLMSALTNETVKTADLDSESRGILMEIGNIVINCILGTMANILECSMDFSLPQYRNIKNTDDLLGGLRVASSMRPDLLSLRKPIFISRPWRSPATSSCFLKSTALKRLPK